MIPSVLVLFDFAAGNAGADPPADPGAASTDYLVGRRLQVFRCVAAILSGLLALRAEGG